MLRRKLISFSVIVTGHPCWSLFLALWGVVVVGLVDDVIEPLLIRAGMEMRSAVESSR
jgi:predicted PurR-regulated permease PerM